LAHEFQVFVAVAKAHDPLDAGPVVPGAVEKDDFAARRQVVDVTLEIPLAAFRLGRFLERHDARAPGVQVLHETLDGAALAGGVTALEQRHDALPRFLDPALHLQEFDLELLFMDVVGLTGHPRLVGVGTAAERLTDRFRVLFHGGQAVDLRPRRHPGFVFPPLGTRLVVGHGSPPEIGLGPAAVQPRAGGSDA